jgi:predicted AAA+ superfamily ATPase
MGRRAEARRKGRVKRRGAKGAGSGGRMKRGDGRYIHRVTDPVIERKLRGLGGLLIVGPKWCGKTTTAERFAKSAVYLDDAAGGGVLVEVASLNPGALLRGKSPRLIDEWQLAPPIFDAARREIDKRGKAGQYILTGSATPPVDEARHSGTGRFSRVQMYPMSLFETGESNGSASLEALFDGGGGPCLSEPSSLTVDRLAEAIVRGGWPGCLSMPKAVWGDVARDYLASLESSTFLRLADRRVKRNPEKVRALIRSYARNTATMASMETILADVGGAGATVSRAAADQYVADLRQLFVVQDQPAWGGALRSRTPLRAAPKRHLADPSLAAAALGASKAKLLQDFKTMGFLFESLCVRDLRVYGSPLGAEVSHYRDKTGLEADAILTLPDGRWGAFEVKLGARQEDEAARNLLAVAARIDAERSGAPAFLAILTAGSHALRRADGVYVIPAGCLGP